MPCKTCGFSALLLGTTNLFAVRPFSCRAHLAAVLCCCQYVNSRWYDLTSMFSPEPSEGQVKETGDEKSNSFVNALSGTVPAPRYGHSIGILNSVLYVTGGSTSSDGCEAVRGLLCAPARAGAGGE